MLFATSTVQTSHYYLMIKTRVNGVAYATNASTVFYPTYNKEKANVLCVCVCVRVRARSVWITKL